MQPKLLRPLFTRALRASLATPLLLAGCDGDDDLDLTGYASPACEQSALAVSGLSLPSQPDFVQLRQVGSNPGLENGRIETAVSSSGTACATANDKAACESALSGLTSPGGFRRDCQDLCSEYYVATTRGDEVKAHDTLDKLRSLLGPIDTAQEAALLAFGEGYYLSCTDLKRGAVKAGPGGTFSVVGTKGYACGPNTAVTQYLLEVTPSGEVKEVSSAVIERGDPGCSIGRRPAGLRAPGNVACTDALGRHFAVVAHLEAASINAFLRLREELELHGADVELRDAALRSAMDEVLHTDVSQRLAHRFGATPRPPQVEALPPRSLFEVALDNAVEGCVRETFGALVAHHQALHARDAEVRQEMTRIAEDETRHAELSWAIDAWAQERLSPAEREALREARRKAVETLRAEVATPLEAALITEAGMPAPEVAASLVDTLAQQLWA
ncbi:ferritin-like domain-containing protein [Pyxidicoccus fallax]|uniref:Ferritin-like domain-containing protein n=1 Tax=Pyxidicoccus fallax TaxID=394095 RepID=A0A848LWV5_9BACT|nr:ferritin-like domain-containing protein [Pyxidicoccus fallax]NMO22266.1 ferritin-like domain-containing protein [Pyxidicoccus fallax]NPC83848.1 ferritin-like domain-containing protein [Pyxidicoccus fallax]